MKITVNNSTLDTAQPIWLPIKQIKGNFCLMDGRYTSTITLNEPVKAEYYNYCVEIKGDK
jgi:hypothetical protein